jgi:hypothetical protein
MIDTDKYEGHTEGPWCVIIDDGMHITPDEDNSRRIAKKIPKEADADLIADAPDLLAEVKALQLDLKDTVDICDRLEEQEADALAEVKRLREQLVEAKDWVWIEGGHIFETNEDRLKHYKEYIGDDEE